MVQDYTIEHIMPQNENLNANWRTDLGEDWKRIHSQYLHTLGNLTLTGYNSEYSDRAFKDKRDMDGGFHQSPLRLNEGLGTCEVWNEQSIQKRANRLSEKATKIWIAPILPPDILETYRNEGKEESEYSLSDHPYVDGGITRELFDAFRTEVLALDECVREVVLKLYIAFKAETNFVDVVPQAKRLRLSLNIDFPEVDDPRKLCKDVTGVGRWGNGNTEVFLEKLEDIPYIIGLVRQSLERQLGDEENELSLL
jgi:predicted transport protein